MNCGPHSVIWINAIALLFISINLATLESLEVIYRCISGTKSYEFRSCPLNVHEQTILKLMVLLGFLTSY